MKLFAKNKRKVTPKRRTTVNALAIDLTVKQQDLITAINLQLRQRIRTLSIEYEWLVAGAINSNFSSIALADTKHSIILVSIADTEIKWHRQILDEGKITSIQFWVDPDGQDRLAVAYDHGAINLYSRSENDPPFRIFQAHTKGITAICVTEDGKYLVSVSKDFSIKLWDLAEKSCKAHLPYAHAGSITTVAISQKAGIIATGGEDSTGKIWGFDDLNLIHELRGISRNPISCVSFNRAGTLLAIADNSVIINVIDTKTTEIIRVISDDLTKFRRAEFDSESLLLMSYGDSPNIKFWDVGSGELKFEISQTQTKESGDVCFARFLNKQKVFVVRSDTSLEIYDLGPSPPNKQSQLNTFPDSPVKTIGMSKYFFSLHSNNTLYAWEPTEWVPIFSYSQALEGPIQNLHKFSMNFSNCGTKLLVSSQHEFALFDVQSTGFAKIKGSKNDVGYSVLSKNLKFILSINQEAKIKVWGTRSEEKQELFTMSMPKDLVTGLAQNPYLLAITSDDKMVVGAVEADLIIWDLNEKDISRRFKSLHSRGAITHLVLSHDDKYAFSAASDEKIVITDLHNKEIHHRLNKFYKGTLTDMCLSRNDKILMVSTEEGKSALWDLAYEQLIHTITWDNPRSLSSCLITEDRYKFIVGSKDGRIAVFSTELLDKTVHWRSSNSGETGSKTVLGICAAKNHLLCSEGHNISMIDMTTLLVVAQIEFAIYQGTKIQEILVNSSATYLIVVSEREIAVWDYRTNTILQRNHEIFSIHGKCLLRFTPTGDCLVTMTETGDIIIWTLPTLEKIASFNLCQKGISAFICSKAQDLIIAATNDLNLTLASIQDRKTKSSFMCHWHTGTISDLILTKDETFLLAASKDGTISRIDLSHEKLDHKFEGGHEYSISKLALNEEESLLISLDMSGKMTLWDLKRKALYTKINSFSSDSKSLIIHERMFFTVSKTGSIQKWNNPFYFGAPGAKCASLNYDYYLSLCPIRAFLEESESHAVRQNLIATRTDSMLYPECWNWNHICILNCHIESFKTICEKGVPFRADAENMFPHEYLIVEIRPTKEKRACLKWILQKLAEGSFEMENVMNAFQSLTEVFFKYHSTLSDEDFINYLTFFSVDAALVTSERLIKQGRVKARKGYDFSALDFSSPNFAENQSKLVEESYRRSTALIETSVIGMTLSFRIEDPETAQLLHILADRNLPQLFEKVAILTLIEYFWRICKNFQLILALFFSVYALIFSVYSVYRIQGISQQHEEGILVVIMIFSISFISLEATQFSGGMRTYIMNIWNSVDVISAALPLATSLVILSRDPSNRSGSDLDTAVAWSLLAIYFKWITCFRLSDQTRKFIRMIAEIAKDMRSFLLIVLFTIIGFSLIFYQFASSTDDFGQFMLEQYLYLYGNQPDTNDFDTSQIIFFIIITLFLALILTNMLIALMSDTYNRVDGSSMMADNLEKISLILEYATLKRQVLKFLRICFKRRLSNTSHKTRRILLVVEEYRHGGSSLISEGGRLTVLEKKIDKLAQNILPSIHEKMRDQIEQLDARLIRNVKEIRTDNNELLKSFDGIQLLDQLDKLDNLKRLDTLPKLETLQKLDKLDKLDKIEKLDKIDRLDKITNRFDQLDSIKNLDKLEKLSKLDKLDSLNRLDSLKRLDSLSNLDRLDQLDKLSWLSRLEKLDKMDLLYKLDLLQQLEKLDKLDQVKKLDNLNKLDALSKLDKLEKLDGLGNLDGLKNLHLLENLKKLESLKDVKWLNELDSKLDQSLKLDQTRSKIWDSVNSKLDKLDKLDAIQDLSWLKKFEMSLDSDKGENVAAISSVQSKLDHILNVIAPGLNIPTLGKEESLGKVPLLSKKSIDDSKSKKKFGKKTIPKKLPIQEKLASPDMKEEELSKVTAKSIEKIRTEGKAPPQEEAE